MNAMGVGGARSRSKERSSQDSLECSQHPCLETDNECSLARRKSGPKDWEGCCKKSRNCCKYCHPLTNLNFLPDVFRSFAENLSLLSLDCSGVMSLLLRDVAEALCGRCLEPLCIGLKLEAIDDYCNDRMEKKSVLL